MSDDYWKSKAEGLEKRLEDERRGTKFAIGSIVGCVIYAASGQSWTGVFLGLAVAIVIAYSGGRNQAN
jgi:uncharacterized membrane protein